MQVQEGEGWRLVVDPERHPYPVLIGGGAWAAELAADEALALRTGVSRLLEQHRSLRDALLEEEAVTLEFEVGLGPEAHLWIELEGDRRQWLLRFVLTPPPGRRALEAGWSAAAGPAFAAALLLCDGLRRLERPEDETERIVAIDQQS